jgi:hypothetical protein
VGGLSGAVSFEALTFFDIGSFILDTATNDTAAGNDIIHIGGAGMVAAGLNTLLLNVGIGANYLSIAGGTTNLDTNVGIGGVNLNVQLLNTTVLNFAASQRLAGLTMTETARVNVAGSGNSVLSVTSLNMEAATSIDLAGNAMIVQSASAARASVYANVRSLIRSARNNGAWNGSGGITSSAAADDLTRNTGLAAIINDRGDGTVVRAQLGGMNVDVNSILIKYTYNGDGDLSGTLTADDYARIDIGFASHSTTDYYSGDFNYSDTTNFDDFFIIDKAFAGQGAPLSAPAASAETVRARRAARRKQHHHVRRKAAREPIWLMFPHRR